MCLSSHFTRVGAKAPVANIKCHRDAAKSCSSSCSATQTLYSPARPHCYCLHPPPPPALSSWATHPSLIPGIQKIQMLFENISRRFMSTVHIWLGRHLSFKNLRCIRGQMDERYHPKWVRKTHPTSKPTWAEEIQHTWWPERSPPDPRPTL